ncbi:MAG: DUF554 domain-containing protein [Bacillota bacterium]
MILLGSIVNAITIIAGGIIGSLAKKGLPERFSNLIISGMGLFTLVLGIMFALRTKEPMIVVISIVIGALIGELIDIEKKLDSLGNYVQSKLKGFKGNFSQGFVTSSLLFCVGSMAIMGSLQSGLSNNHDTLLTKSIMDGVISIVFASTMGIGVAASAVPVFIYQGTITLLASVIAPYLSEAMIIEMTASGGILLMGVGINILELKKIKVGNMLPAIFLPIIIMLILGY